MGHAGQTVLQRYRDQSVGHRLLRPAETVSRGGAQVRAVPRTPTLIALLVKDVLVLLFISLSLFSLS